MLTGITLNIILITWLINNWDSQTIDVETAFLYTDIAEEIYMKMTELIAELLEEIYSHDDILALIKFICGLVQE